MAQTPREVPVELRISTEAIDAGDAFVVIEAQIAALVAAEVERRIATERAGFLRILTYLAFQHGERETEADGSGEQATIHIPDAAMVGDDPEVVTWRNEWELETTYQVRRRRPAPG